MKKIKPLDVQIAMAELGAQIAIRQAQDSARIVAETLLLWELQQERDRKQIRPLQ